MLSPHQFIGGVSASPCSPPGWVRQCWAQGQRRVWPRGSTGFLRDHKSQVWSGWPQVRVNKCQSDLESMTDMTANCNVVSCTCACPNWALERFVKNMICEIWVIWWYYVLWTNASSIDQFMSISWFSCEVPTSGNAFSCHSYVARSPARQNQRRLPAPSAEGE